MKTVDAPRQVGIGADVVRAENKERITRWCLDQYLMHRKSQRPVIIFASRIYNDLWAERKREIIDVRVSSGRYTNDANNAVTIHPPGCGPRPRPSTAAWPSDAPAVHCILWAGA